ncbi:MAG: hypothetical protein K6A23_11555 [Butyrivibrio sp.]|nr:hypothetical protein [Butyrivibrio sp.]
MGNLDNKEKEFAKMLADVTRLAREQKGVISSEQVQEAFEELDLSKEQYDLVYEYLKNHNIGIGEALDSDEILTGEESSYLQEYLDELEMLPDVSDAEKEGITISAMAGDINAQKKLIEIYLKNVPDIAKLYAEQGVYLEDLIGEGNVALTRGVTMLNAIEKPSEADAFLGRMMMDAMEDLIAENIDEAGRANTAVQKVQEVADRAKELSEQVQRKVTVEELMEETGWEREKIIEAIKLSANNIEDIDFNEEDY